MSRINMSFQQKHNSCVLASYAVVANYYTGVKIGDVFSAYYKYFDLANLQAVITVKGLPYGSKNFSTNVEEACADHLNSASKLMQWYGYRMIKYVHEDGTEDVFKKNRETFSIHKLKGNKPEGSEFEELYNLIRNDKCLINILTRPSLSGNHSQTIGIDDSNEEKFFLHDTACTPLNQITNPTFESIKPKILNFIVFKNQD